MKILLRALLVAALAVCGLPAYAAHQDGNLVCETTTTTGTGSLTLSETGCDGGDFVTFASQITTGNTITYSIVASDGTLETGTAVYTAGSPDQITSRSAIWSSDGSGVELTLPAGTHRVYLQWNTASYQGGINAFDVLSISVDNLNDVTALNATTESTIEAALDTLANVTSIGGDVTAGGDFTSTDDTIVGDDLTLSSTGALINIGPTADCVITHSSNTLTLSGCTGVGFGAGGGLSNVVEDLTPQLGGTLDFNGQIATDVALTLETTFNFDEGGITLYQASDGAAGPKIFARHDSASPADGDIAFGLYVAAGADDEFVGQIRMELDDGATTTEDTQWQFVLRSAGADLTALTLGGTLGAYTPAAIVNLGTTDAGIFAVTNTNAAEFGPYISTYHNSASPADDDIVGGLIISGNNDTAEVKNWGYVEALATDVTTDTEDSIYKFWAQLAGTQVAALVLSGSAAQLGETTGTIDLGTSTIGVDDVFLAEGSIINWDNGDLTLTQTGNDIAVGPLSSNLVVGNATSLATFETEAGGDLQPNIQTIATDATGSFAGARFQNVAGGVRFYLATSRGATVGNYTIITANDTLGSFLFLGSDGTDFEVGAAITATGDGTPGADDMPGRLIFGTTADAASTPTSRWIIDSVGALKPAVDDAVAIGTTALRVSDLFLAEGAVINWDNGDATITQTSNDITVGGITTFELNSATTVTAQLQSDDAGAVGSIIQLFHNSASSADGDLAAQIDVLGGADDEEIGSIAMEVDDGATTTEDTRWRHTVRTAGADLEIMTLNGGNNGGGFSTKAQFSLGTCDGCTFEVYTNTTGVQGPTMFMTSDSASPAAGDVAGQIWTQFEDNGGGATPGWRIIGNVVDVVAATEDLNLTFSVMTAGAVVSMLALGDTGTALDAAVTWIGSSGYTANNGTGIYFEETEANGDNYKAFVPIAAITTSTTCTFENDANFIPDSCVGDGSDASDGRLKTDLKPAGEVGALLDQIKIYDYAWTEDAPEASEAVRKGKRGFGPVAQELINVNADFVEAGGDDPVKDPWTWKPDQVVPYLIVEIQHLRQRVKELEARDVH